MKKIHKQFLNFQQVGERKLNIAEMVKQQVKKTYIILAQVATSIVVHWKKCSVIWQHYQKQQDASILKKNAQGAKGQMARPLPCDLYHVVIQIQWNLMIVNKNNKKLCQIIQTERIKE